MYEEARLPAADEEPKTVGPKTFIVAARDYIEAQHEDRFVCRIVQAVMDDPQIPSDVSIDDIDEVVIRRLQVTMYPNAQPQTVHRQLHTPTLAVINKARDRWQSIRVKVKDRPSERWLTPEEVERLLSAAGAEEVVGRWDPHRRTLQKIAVMLGSGAGPGEAFEVGAEDVMRQTQEVWIQKDKTDYRRRLVHVPDRAWKLMGKLPSEGPVFLRPDGKPYVIRKNGGGQMSAAFKTVREAAGLGPDVTPYTLRHTWATWFHAENQDTVMLRHRGGWANDRMIMRYAKLPPADLVQRMRGHGWSMAPPVGKVIPFGSLAQV